MKFYILIASVLLVSYIPSSHAQQTSACTNSDFELNNFSNWIGFTGDCCPVNANNPGIVNGRHTIVSGTGFDPNSNNLVPMVAPGGGLFSARLGNSQSGAESERLSFTFTVTPNLALFIYRFAVILEDPGHDPIDQPRFSIRVFDQGNQPITCGAYDVVSGADIPGFISYGSLRIKPWTTVGIELTNYIGQQVTIEFTTADCGRGAHFGYAYMDCYCSPFTITSDICPGSNTVTLTAPEGFSTYLWSNGDTLPNTTIVNPVLGTVYTCMVTSVTGCQVTLQTQLTPTNLTAEFYTVMECQNETRFIDSSYVVTGSAINQWKWKFGDGTVSSDQNPVHVFPASGYYNVTLIVFNINCSDTITKIIYIKPSPICNFSYIPECLGDPVSFINQSTFAAGTITVFKWDFGDGSTNVYLQNPSHAFATSGPFQVELEIETDNGCRDQYSQQLMPVIDPSATLTYVASCNNTEVSFNALPTYSCGPIVSYIWNFGDGSPAENIQNPTHQYPSTGAYTVNLTLTAMNGIVANISLSIIVPEYPVVNFSATPACNLEPALFADQSTVANGSIIGYEWYFGDGTFLDGNQNESHIYPTEGNYNVMLKVTTDHLCIDSITNLVSIWELPVSDFNADLLSGCEPLAVPLHSTSSIGDGWIEQNEWLVGLFITETASDPYLYLMTGLYDVQLIATSNNGCKDTLVKENYLEVFPLPNPNFIHSPKPATIYNPEVKFYDITPNVLSRYWDFGNGNFSYQLNPIHLFSGKGVYSVKLFVTSNDGCENSIIKPVEVIDLFTIFFPNAFTPNGDGINDYYESVGEKIKDVELLIFNRWGEMVFSGSGKNPKWDGRGASGEVIEGVYSWRARIKDEDGEDYEKVGTMALIK